MTNVSDALWPYVLAVVAGLFAHACLQLGVSMLTLLNSHAIGSGRAHAAVLRLSFSYSLGALAATVGLVIALTYIFTSLFPFYSTLEWTLLAGLIAGVGIAVLLFYYRRGKGTLLWLPRGFVEFASSRAKKTKNTVEAFSLGLMMVIAELPFLIAPIALTAAILSGQPSLERSIGIGAYSLAACLPLFSITALIGSGHKISTIQRWRENNKNFLQWSSGLTLILLSIYVFAINVWSAV